MSDFTNTIPGTLPVGTITPQGTIEAASLTAYRMTSGEWVAFRRVHGTPAFARPLVTLG
jgi:hypothetical protein